MLDDGIGTIKDKGVGSLVACNCICLHAVELTDSLNSFEFWTLKLLCIVRVTILVKHLGCRDP